MKILLYSRSTRRTNCERSDDLVALHDRFDIGTGLDYLAGEFVAHDEASAEGDDRERHGAHCLIVSLIGLVEGASRTFRIVQCI